MSEMFQHYFIIKRFEYLLKQTAVLFKTLFKWFFWFENIKGKVK